MNLVIYVVFQGLFCLITASNWNRNTRYTSYRPVPQDIGYEFRYPRNRINSVDTRLGFSVTTPTFAHANKVPSFHVDKSTYGNDRLDFHYPKVEFLTKIDRKYSTNIPEDIEDELLENQKFVVEPLSQPNRFNRKNKLTVQTIDKNTVEYQPVKLSYIEKPKRGANTTAGSKYDGIIEESIEHEKGDKSTTKNNIHDFLKGYFLKLYNQKYNTSEVRPNTYSRLTDNQSKDEAEKKFIGNIAEKIKKKKGQLLSLVTIVQFNNTQCNATSSLASYLGVCYTAAECNRIEGTAVGNCASGYGVCCVGKCEFLKYLLFNFIFKQI